MNPKVILQNYMNLSFIPQKTKDDDKEFLSSNKDLNPVMTLTVWRPKIEIKENKWYSFGKEKPKPKANASLAKFKV